MANSSKTFGLFGPLNFTAGRQGVKLSMPLLVLAAICFFALPAQAQYGGGSGTAGDPYLIYTPEELNAVGARSGDWNKNFQLRADIDLAEYTETNFNIIGSYTNFDDNRPFTGVFDGNDHTVSNFTYTSHTAEAAGLFGYVTGEIKNLGLISPNISAGAGYNVGSLAGNLGKGTITGCYARGVTVWGSSNVGGLVGSTDGRIENCYSSGMIWGDTYAAGFVGQVGDGTVLNCYSTATVSGSVNVGGFVGKTAKEKSVVRNCYATGSVTGDSYVGGMAGQVEQGAVYKCYSTGSVSGNRDAGGLVGYVRVLGRVLNSFWDTQTSGQSTSAGGTGKTTEQMMRISTFTPAGWDFWNTWTICEEMNYPVLQCHIPAADFRCPDGVNFIDFAFFASHWHQRHCYPSNSYCDGTDLDQSGLVDFRDLAILADNWLVGVSN